MKEKILVWSLTVVLLAAAWGVSKATLTDDAATAPFPTVAALDEPVAARNLAATVTDVHVATRVTDAEGWTAEGTWLVVDLTAATVVTQQSATLRLAELVIGDRTFTATDRGTTLVGQRLFTGVPRSGSIAFELPADALTGSGVLRLGVPSEASPNDVPLDGVIELTVRLDELPVEVDVALDENGWAR